MSKPGCPRCGEATTHGEHCGACLHKPPHFASTTAVFRYEFPVDRMIHSLKYAHQLALAPWLGAQLAEAVSSLSFDGIVAMPLHESRLRERGFNQALEIARPVATTRKIRLSEQFILRTRTTQVQAGLPLKARHANLRGAFECTRDLSGKTILLIDDVMTSGATVDECARILQLHGADEVHVAVVARALKPRDMV